MLLYCLAIAGGCLGLYIGGDLLLRGAMAIGRSLGWSTAIIGFVLVSFGTSAPELFVSSGAALQGLGDISAGNVVGSNIVNVAIVLGLGAMIFPLSINHYIRTRQLPMMLGLSLIGFAFLFNGHLSRAESLILMIAVAGSLWFAIKAESGTDASLMSDLGPDSDSDRAPGAALNPVLKSNLEPIPAAKSSASETQAAVPINKLLNAAYLVAGILLLVFGAEGLIWGGVGVAAAFGVPDAVIALTVTSIGTSLPEITATVIAVARKDSDLAVGNVVGSNLLNIGLVLGMSGFIAPIDSAGVGMLSLITMLALSGALAVLAWTPGYIARWVGGSLLVAYVAYMLVLLH